MAVDTDTVDTDIAGLLERCSTTSSEEALRDLLLELSAHYDSEGAQAAAIRQAFAHGCQRLPGVLREERLLRFLLNGLTEVDFETLKWQKPDDLVRFYELLYSLPLTDEALSAGVTERAQLFLLSALRQYEAAGALEQMFRLLQITPAPLIGERAEILRLKHRAALYEMQRVRRYRRWLYAYLLVQVLLVFVVFPLLFMNAENGAIQRSLEGVIDLEDSPRRQNLRFSDALYWSVITGGSIGYGDILPVTQLGRFLAAALGLMGVITVGVVAGLILSWVTPRNLEYG